jgi:hypothetical protein
MKPGNAGGGKGPQLKGSARSDEGQGIGDEPNNSNQCSEVLLKGMSSEKHFSLPERQKYFSGIQPPATLPTVLL